MSTKLHTVPFLINGSDHISENTADVVSPANGEVTHRYSSADVKDANAAVDAAAEAFKSWRKTRPSERRDLLLKAAEIMERRQDELREYAMTECGSDAAWASFDINTGISHIKEIAGRVGTLEGSIPAVSDPNTTALVLREPYGVVVAIAPW
jgi:acyl-CoA reductase-like NAD-dependent aldehyde dehydrogenase